MKRRGSFIAISIMLGILEYTFYFVCCILGVYSLYKAINSKEERKIYRLKILKEINEKTTKVIKKNQESKLQQRLKSTGLPYINAFKFQVIRTIFIFVVTAYYIISSMIKNNYFDFKILAIPSILFILSEPTVKFSPVHIGIEALIKIRNKRKITEVFTLFDILKSDLHALKPSQQVNIYSILKEAMPMFEHINVTLSRLLSLWKTSPEKAKNVLYEDIGGESTKILGEIIYKLDKTSKEEALSIIEAEASIFSFSYYESEMQHSSKQKTILYGFFTLTSVLIIAWLIFFVFSMFNDTIANNNVF